MLNRGLGLCNDCSLIISRPGGGENDMKTDEPKLTTDRLCCRLGAHMAIARWLIALIVVKKIESTGPFFPQQVCICCMGERIERR